MPGDEATSSISWTVILGIVAILLIIAIFVYLQWRTSGLFESDQKMTAELNQMKINVSALNSERQKMASEASELTMALKKTLKVMNKRLDSIDERLSELEDALPTDPNTPKKKPPKKKAPKPKKHVKIQESESEEEDDEDEEELLRSNMKKFAS